MDNNEYHAVLEILERFREEYPISSDGCGLRNQITNLFHSHVWDTCTKLEREAKDKFDDYSVKMAESMGVK